MMFGIVDGMKHKQHAGFTLVEMLIVIVVIAILVVITAALYQNAQVQARDAQMTDAADKVADAIQLFANKEGHFPRGGLGSTTAAAAGTECVDGAGGWVTTGKYTCSVEDSLVNLGYLPAGYIASLPDNAVYPGQKQAVMVYTYGSNAMVYYSMEQPTASDTARFNTELTQCGINPAGAVTQRDSYGMRNGICFQYQ